jgi:hypothetical protein
LAEWLATRRGRGCDATRQKWRAQARVRLKDYRILCFFPTSRKSGDDELRRLFAQEMAHM